MSNAPENDNLDAADARDEATVALDRATTARLARLATMPVDLSRLGAAIAADVPRPATARDAAAAGRRSSWLRPIRAVAAGIALLAALTIALVAWPGGAAMASPAQMAALHAKLVGGQIPVTRVESVEAANTVLASQSSRPSSIPRVPAVPDLPHDHVMACCLNEVDDRVIACLLLKHGDKPVSMMVADAKDMRSPARGGEVIDRDGVRYHVHASGPITMVMSARHGRWVCVMGELPADALISLASRLQY